MMKTGEQMTDKVGQMADMVDEAHLSERQRQILYRSARGLTDKEIALELGVGEGTLRTYWDRLRERLDARSRTEAVAKVYQERYDQLNARHDELLALLGQLREFAWTAKPSGYVDYCNEWFHRFGGLTPAQCEGQGCRALMLPEEAPAGAERWKQAQETGQPYEADVHFVRGEDGKPCLHRLRLFPLRSATGEIYKWVGCAIALEALL